MKKNVTTWCAISILSFVFGCLGCTSKTHTTDKSEPAKRELKGEPETKELIKAMEEVVAVKDKDKDKMMEAIRRVSAAGKKREDLKLTEPEKKALEDKYGAKIAELQKKMDE